MVPSCKLENMFLRLLLTQIGPVVIYKLVKARTCELGKASIVNKPSQPKGDNILALL